MWFEFRLFDLAGREIAVLEEGFRAAGRHQLTWEGAAFPAGGYFLRLQAGGEVEMGKVVVVK